MLFDTEFIISLGRGEKSVARQRADKFLAENRPEGLYTSRICWAEVAEGFDDITAAHQALARFTVLEVNERVAWIASRLGRHLKGPGLHIGDNDIWIAAAALAYGQPLVTNNGKHFGRVPGLRVLGY